MHVAVQSTEAALAISRSVNSDLIALAYRRVARMALVSHAVYRFLWLRALVNLEWRDQ